MDLAHSGYEVVVLAAESMSLRRVDSGTGLDALMALQELQLWTSQLLRHLRYALSQQFCKHCDGLRGDLITKEWVTSFLPEPTSETVEGGPKGFI